MKKPETPVVLLAMLQKLSNMYVQTTLPQTFVLGTNGKYANDYAATPATALGELTCSTCHSSLHTTYAGTDFSPLTNTAAVSMTMWTGAKSINIAQMAVWATFALNATSHVRLQQVQLYSDGNVVDYAGLVANPTAIFYDNVVGNAAPNKVIPSYRTHVHYGTVGAIYAGIGGVEFPGSLAYENSPHTTCSFMPGLPYGSYQRQSRWTHIQCKR